MVLAIIYNIILRIANYIQTHPRYYTLEYSHFSDSIRSKFLYMVALGIAARNSTKCSRRIPRNNLMCISVILQIKYNSLKLLQFIFGKHIKPCVCAAVS